MPVESSLVPKKHPNPFYQLSGNGKNLIQIRSPWVPVPWLRPRNTRFSFIPQARGLSSAGSESFPRLPEELVA
jgi:hypothetical protein